MELYTWAIAVHVIGAVLGVGTVRVNDLQFWRAIGDKDLGLAFQKSAVFYGKIIKAGLALLVLSGLYFMFNRPVLWGSEKILTKLALVGVLVINGFIINFVLEPKIKRLKESDWEKKSPTLKNVVLSRIPFDAISLTTWYAVLFLGAVGRQPWAYWQIAIGYVLIMVAVYTILRLLLRARLQKSK